MAVQIKKKALTIVRLVERLFKPEQVKGGLLSKATQIQNAGFKLSMTPTTFLISADSGKEMTVVASVMLKLDSVNLAMKGKLGHSSKVAIRDKVIDLITTAHNQWAAHYGENIKPGYMTFEHPDVYEMFITHYVKGNNKVKAIKEVRALTGEGLNLKECKDQVESWIEQYEALKTEGAAQSATEAKIPTDGEKYYNPHAEFECALGDAKMLHQPVKGTSSGSRYHVIAISSTMKVAARIRKNNHIAIRAVSTDASAGSGMQAAGLKKSPAGHYSVHLEPDNLVMAKKCIGSLLFAMGGNFDLISDRIEELVGVGA